MNRYLCLAAHVFTAACASAPASQAPAVPSRPGRPIPYPVTASRGFERAVARGTRTRTGAPGPRYWQQFTHCQLVDRANQAWRRPVLRLPVR